MLTSERKRVILDTSVVIRGLMAKKQNRKESYSYKILRQFESNHFKLMMNASIKNEYSRKLDEHFRKGNIDPQDVSHFMQLVTSPKAQYDREFITPPIDVVDDPTDNIFFLSGNCLTANFLVTVNSKHLNNSIKEDLKKLGSGLQIVNQVEFLGENVKTKIYVSHSTSYNFKDDLYIPLRNALLNEKYNFIFPHEGDKSFNSKETIAESDFILAEVSIASTGQGIELGWADVEQVPIICIHKKGSKIPNSLNFVTSVIIEYDNKKDMLEKINNAIQVAA